jgi:hypothetical protein
VTDAIDESDAEAHGEGDAIIHGSYSIFLRFLQTKISFVWVLIMYS